MDCDNRGVVQSAGLDRRAPAEAGGKGSTDLIYDIILQRRWWMDGDNMGVVQRAGLDHRALAEARGEIQCQRIVLDQSFSLGGRERTSQCSQAPSRGRSKAQHRRQIWSVQTESAVQSPECLFFPFFLYSLLPIFLYSLLPIFLTSYVPFFLYSFLPIFLSSFIPFLIYSFLPQGEDVQRCFMFPPI